jgi:hypothetical protein
VDRAAATLLIMKGGTPTPRKTQKLFRETQKLLRERCENAWRGFGLLPGTHLSCVSVGLFRRELRTAEQQTLASARAIWGGGKATVSAGGRTFTWLTIRASSSLPGIADSSNRTSRGYGWREQPPSLARPRALVDEAQVPIFYTSGANYNGRALARISFPDGRWLRFLVLGTKRANAVMTAVDQAWNEIAYYRISKQRRNPVEITVQPDQSLTDELVLAITISVPWLASYFDVPSEGELGI